RGALVVAAVLPWLELTCGVCLAFGWAVREAALLLAILLVGLLGYSLTHLGQTDCHCFLFPTPTPESVWWPPVRNGLLLMCALRTCVHLGSRGKDARMAGAVEDRFADFISPGE